MNAYLFPIQTAALVFFGIAVMITVPYLAYKYFKQGSLPLFQAVIEGSFVFYMIASFFLTLLPLPSHEYVDALTTPRAQLIPFSFIADFFKHTVLVLSNPSTYIPALKQGVVTQVLFNIIMTIPFGFYLRYYFKKSWKFTLIASLVLSLFYEITQLTGIYGYYSRSYRLFDVDDLFLNTLGGMIGYALTPAIQFVFPSRSALDESIQVKAKRVSYLRRFIAYLIDQYFVAGILAVASLGILGNDLLVSTAIAILMAFTMSKTNGYTLGLWVVKLHVEDANGGKVTLKQALKRNGLFLIFIQLIMPMLTSGFDYLNEFAFENVEVMIFYLVVMLGYFLFFAGHYAITMILRRRQFFYERASHTIIQSDYK